MATLTLIRGLPGSGKTTAAVATGQRYCEADMYFILNGEYVFDPDKLGAAHRWCLETACRWLDQGHDCCVSNTFTQWHELEPYCKHALSGNHEVKIVTQAHVYGSIHNVPQATLDRMAERFLPHDQVMAKLTALGATCQ